jgi:hypothetical protein
MNKYALNVAPIDGWQTWFASGDTAMTLSAQGLGTAAQLAAATAAISLAMEGTPVASVLASASAMISLTIEGNAVIGSQPIIAHPGYGDIELTLRITGTAASIQAADGNASMTLTAEYTFPDPVVIPSAYSPAYRGCVLGVPPENNTLVVPADAPIRVEPAQKLPTVPPMRMP